MFRKQSSRSAAHPLPIHHRAVSNAYPHVLALPHHPDTQSALNDFASTLVDKRLIVHYGIIVNLPNVATACPHPLKSTSSPSLAKPSSPPPIGLTNAMLSKVVGTRVVRDFSALQPPTLPKPRSRAV
ncbi:uncharacterized protein LACBIDRAFT_299678 [Laccaria bicolor S238N-H82]|uniref:Predicted protein n=1 Tax=Laccaria bicolor (strain S238N-H82 / ATCC MYA-4686) TaxID=486041 RepID=B0DF56_LACBS|nr:uncharacterized protein LACBIDRAFT_299678 [Laccaria bicolor S238N-H82]EDR06797.1 predicted protein [Laccaria bicolor S238N-H82]|eukprot:XP_001882644.1 predicted protein [Laccaria bicolor S238N-H82]